MNLPLQSLFKSIYSNDMWNTSGNSHQFYSGYGSHNPQLIYPYIGLLIGFFKTLPDNFSILDIGCGDFNIGSQLSKHCKNYTAVDIVEPLIQHNKQKFKDLNVDFKLLDITTEECSYNDVIILKEILQHLSNDNILKVLKNIYKKSKYLIIYESLPLQNFKPNIDIKDSYEIRTNICNSGVVITDFPFNFPIISNLYELTIQDSLNSIKKINIYQTYE